MSSIMLGAALVCGMPWVAHAGPGGESFEQAMARAGALSEEGKHEDALGSFEAAFAAMPAEIRVGSVGEFVVYSGSRSAIAVFNATGEPVALERGKALLTSFLDAVEGAKDGMSTASTDRARTTLSIIDDMLESAAQSGIEPPEDPPAEPAEPEPEPEPEPPEPPPESKRDRVGLALTIVGGLATAGGVATIVAGIQQVPWYEGELEHFGWEPDATDYDYEQKLDEARRVRNIDIGVGAGLTAVGVGLLVYGAIRLKSGGRPAKDTARGVAGGIGLAAGRRPTASLTLRF